MSDAEVKQMTDEQESGEQMDASQLAETGVSNPDESTQESAGTEQEEVEQIDLSTLAGTQPEKTEKEHNNLYASNRVKTKKLKDLEAQIASGNVPDAHAFKPEAQSEKPKLADFVSDDVLFDKYGSSEAIALAAYNEAKEDWNAHGSTVVNQRTAHNEQLVSNVQGQIAQEEAFESNIEKHRGAIKGLDDSLAHAEKLFGEADFNLIRDHVGDNAPLVLAVLGSNSAERDAFVSSISGGQASVIKHLTRLEDRIVSNLPSVNKISKSNTETPLGGGNTDSTGDLQKKIDAAAKSSNVEEYQRLKRIQKGLK